MVESWSKLQEDAGKQIVPSLKTRSVVLGCSETPGIIVQPRATAAILVEINSQRSDGLYRCCSWSNGVRCCLWTLLSRRIVSARSGQTDSGFSNKAAAVTTASFSNSQSVRSVRNLLNVTPAELMPCPGATQVTTCMTFADYDEIVSAVRGALESLPVACTTSNCPQADWAGCVLRMAGHDFMDFANGQGGSDACTDMAHAENGGLARCLASGEHGVALLDIYQQFCTDVSLADFLVISAEAVIMSTRARHIASNPGALPLDFRSRLRFWPSHSYIVSIRRGSLVLASPGPKQLLSWESTPSAVQKSAILGTMDGGVIQRTPGSSTTTDYVSLLAKGWIPELAVSGNAGKNQWERSDIGRDTSLEGHEMMLNTDLCLVYSENGQNGGPVLATEHDCCAWLTSDTIQDAVANNEGEYCGGSPGRGERGQCCGNQNNDCGNRDNPTGPATDAVLRFAADEPTWLESFAEAWLIATENGHAELHPLGSCTTTTEATTTTTLVTTTRSTTVVTTTTITPAATTTTTPVATTTTAPVATTTTTPVATTTTTPVATTTTTPAVTTTTTPAVTTTTITTTRPETTTTTLGSTTDGLTLLRGFSVVDGRDRACEGDGPVTRVSSLDVQQCQMQCSEMESCRGVSFAEPVCELWAERIEAGHDIAKGSEVVRLVKMTV